MIKEDLLIPFIGGVVVAGIAGAISLVLAILAKDQKTSEFRQSWIDALREDTASLAGLWYVITSTAYLHLARGGGDEFVDSKHAEFIDMEVRICRIILRLNVEEHSVLIGMLRGLSTRQYASKSERECAMNDVCAEVQTVLKTEWERVKAGELSFKILKYSSLFVFLLGVLSVIWLFVFA